MSYTVYHIHVLPELSSGYIGITKNPTLRFSQHGWKRKKSNPHLKFALKKYENLIQYSVLSSGLDYETACWVERIFRPFPNMGWNISKGGDVPPNPKGKERSEEYRKNISVAKIGEKNPMFGKKLIFTTEHKLRLSAASKAMPYLKCPHCGKEARSNGMKRWHFDRCRYANK